MSRDLAIQNEAPVPAEYDALDAAIGNDLDGEPLRFKDGVFLEGFDKNRVVEGTVLRIEPTSVQDGFMKYEDRKTVDWRCASGSRVKRQSTETRLATWTSAIGPMAKTLGHSPCSSP